MTNQPAPVGEQDVAAIAAGLSKAQRRAVARAEYREASGAWQPAGWYVSADRRVRLALCRLKLTPDYLRKTHKLTPLGLRVSALLERNSA